jgi:enoyl-CoA hydratase/carnithine racemase
MHASFDYALTPNGVATITLNRPARYNSLTFAVYKDLTEFFAELSESRDVRAIVITGNGKAFCSGGDVEEIIGELFARGAQEILAFTRLTGALIRAMRACRKPVLAAVNGVAVGAGAVIALASDIRIASEHAKFGFIFPNVGLAGADMGAAYLLPRVVGLGHASELLFTGDIIHAERAQVIGLVNRVTSAETLLPETYKLAERLASGPAFAHAMTKQMLESEQTMSLDQAIEAEAQAQAICMMHPDFRTAYDAWQTKMEPQFQGSTVPFARPNAKPSKQS